MEKLEIVLRVGEHEAVIPTRLPLPSAEELAEMKPYFGIPPDVDLQHAVAAEVAMRMVDWRGEMARQEASKDLYIVNHPPSEALKTAVFAVLVRSNKNFLRRAIHDGREE